ncbi:DUF1772 domain-containing protein [Corynebacterium ammoniagenes]|uniref:DUF1772 domain-containing protein n=2 Tax=Corynebacterium ammoniagenes TaxID=1697 RepID=A0AAV5G631_CORAM|nr:DUF1772 domain-containing protein [Corynebacterium ammoniagenes]APT83003.1 hypothetical protein CAMM_08750 [Corynebacterium ammoniagenes DSM 20306]AQS74040.1 hypothetical protein CA40472_09070 [Corynebacterium ammoniagenes]EFG81930.1 hypothetical protein HMPREF0281_00635 [Corynebacterium ammoniagenes DSM 20306]GJN42731.1 hypothetical protein CAT723_12100 [Corynebacterium ammoniagenes]
MSWLAAVTVLITGFFGSAEFASTAFVHPIIRKLDPDTQLLFEKGLLTTFGKVMPFGMTLGVILTIALAVDHTNYFTISAAIALVVALIVTIFGNVPINKATGDITETSASKKFLAMRRTWDRYQLIRGSLQVLGFVLIVIGVTLSV